VSAVPDLVCSACGLRTSPDPRRFRCACGGVVDLDGPADVVPVDLGAVATPLVRLPDPDLDVRLKLEGLSATGSFKDRGAATLIGFLAGAGVERAVADSSGNAGAAIAAHCARAGIALDLYVPASAAPGKLVQARAHGANVIAVDGPRQAAADAAGAAVERGAVYATHAWSPYFLAGTAAFATELLEQLGAAPDALVLPVGSGTLLLGIWPLLAALPRPPRVYAVQSAACAPLFSATGDVPAEVVPEPSLAEGVLVARPPRGAQAIAVVRASGGRFLALPDDALGPALRRLARAGVFAEPTAALAAAALDVLRDGGELRPGETVVCAVTGHGLKAPAAVEALLG
jgi:threonine synthase